MAAVGLPSHLTRAEVLEFAIMHAEISSCMIQSETELAHSQAIFQNEKRKQELMVLLEYGAISSEEIITKQDRDLLKRGLRDKLSEEDLARYNYVIGQERLYKTPSFSEKRRAWETIFLIKYGVIEPAPLDRHDERVHALRDHEEFPIDHLPKLDADPCADPTKAAGKKSELEAALTGRLELVYLRESAKDNSNYDFALYAYTTPALIERTIAFFEQSLIITRDKLLANTKFDFEDKDAPDTYTRASLLQHYAETRYPNDPKNQAAFITKYTAMLSAIPAGEPLTSPYNFHTRAAQHFKRRRFDCSIRISYYNTEYSRPCSGCFENRSWWYFSATFI